MMGSIKAPDVNYYMEWAYIDGSRNTYRCHVNYDYFAFVVRSTTMIIMLHNLHDGPVVLSYHKQGWRHIFHKERTLKTKGSWWTRDQHVKLIMVLSASPKLYLGQSEANAVALFSSMQQYINIHEKSNFCPKGTGVTKVHHVVCYHDVFWIHTSLLLKTQTAELTKAMSLIIFNKRLSSWIRSQIVEHLKMASVQRLETLYKILKQFPPMKC